MPYIILILILLIIYGLYRFIKAWGEKISEERAKERKIIEEHISIRVFNYADNEGVTLLMKCLMYNFEELTKKLLNSNIKIDKSNHHGETAIFYAIQFNRWEAFNKIISLGANLEQRNVNGETPVWYASQKSDSRYLEGLLEKEVLLDIPDKRYNLTPIFVAVKNRKVKNIRLLYQAGANIYHESKEGNLLKLIDHYIEPYYSGVSYETYETKEIIRKIRTDYNNKEFYPMNYETYKQNYLDAYAPKE